ncbi:MAG: indolepyruvate oxidoreductase subunit beta [Clostridia bacterium]|nr:indolepyruvate oxidoreductase subunit beta [Clostridia bacterium]
MESKKLNILIVGVGGQGTLLASKFIGMAARLAGRDVKVSEVHGMSQRGGSVVTCVKMGDEVFSPVIDLGEADVMLSFEQVEAVRWLPYLKKGGTVITSEQKIEPMSVVLGDAVYPDNVIEALEKSDAKVIHFDALKAAEAQGSVKTVNIILCGVLSRMIDDITPDIWSRALRMTVAPKFLEMNEKAFAAGASIDF